MNDAETQEVDNEESMIMEHWRLWSMDRSIGDYELWLKYEGIKYEQK